MKKRLEEDKYKIQKEEAQRKKLEEQKELKRVQKEAKELEARLERERKEREELEKVRMQKEKEEAERAAEAKRLEDERIAKEKEGELFQLYEQCGQCETQYGDPFFVLKKAVHEQIDRAKLEWMHQRSRESKLWTEVEI